MNTQGTATITNPEMAWKRFDLRTFCFSIPDNYLPRHRFSDLDRGKNTDDQEVANQNKSNLSKTRCQKHMVRKLNQGINSPQVKVACKILV